MRAGSSSIVIGLDQKGIGSKVLNKMGGKGRSLWELQRHHIPIPKGFVLSTDGQELFFSENDLRPRLIRLSTMSRGTELRKALRDMRNAVKQGALPLQLREAIRYGMKRYSACRYAVRSSANVEDGSKKSWAGEFESYINVLPEQVEDAVKQCWASMFQDRVVAYAGGPMQLPAIRMAIVIQMSIDSDVAGVCFTMNPLGDDGEVLIEAVFGIGELLVLGETSPDRYVVEKQSDIILDIVVNEQNRMYKPLDGGGTGRVSMRKTFQQKLSGYEIVELAKIAKRIEGFYKAPQDIEWCKKGERLFILQSRPITAVQGRARF